tara:strand:+ start:535 stop:825 length:291 start_codon:yes stop_codon:yes gene_type:complete
MTTIAEVIGWKFNHQEGMSTKSGVITEFPGGIPSQEDQDAWTEEYLVVYDAQEYARKREAEYPPWDEQLDHIYHNGVESWKTNVVKPVKDKYPKPG